MAYLTKTRRTASILAATKTILIKLNVQAIEQTSITTQLRFYRIFSNTLIDRLSRANENHHQNDLLGSILSNP